MEDEIKRNMKELSIESYEVPFFIAFAIGDVKTMSIASVFGSNITSSINTKRTSTSRVMVGDYQVNDENYNARTYDNSMDLSYLEVPVDDDYYGIRRAIWISVNNVYKSAAKKYKSKLKDLERNNIHKDSLELPDFSKEKVQKIDIKGGEFKFDQQKYEKLADELSVIFTSHPAITSSNISIFFYQSRVYFVNSEGTNVSFPLTLASINVDASTLCDDGTPISENINYIASRPDDLPTAEILKSDIEAFIQNIEALKQLEVYEGNYEGPVLFQGSQVGNLFASIFFRGDDDLVGYRENISFNNGASRNYFFHKSSLSSKIDKKIAHHDISVFALPKLETYKGVHLIGTTKVDAEGVVPPDTIELVKEGKINTLLNNRTPCKEISQSNGHFRAEVASNYLSRQVGPSIIKVESANSISHDSLKNKLIETAKEEGLEYALLFKTLPTHASTQSTNAYKVNLETGEETLLRGVTISTSAGFDLKDILGLSDKEVIVNNIFSARGYGGSTFGGTGVMGLPFSIISPDGILFEELELEGSRAPFSPDLPIMPSPLEEANK